MKDTITYRNKFCALCNAVDFVSDLIKWRLEILCGTVLELPDKNLLITIKEKQCEIVFKPPNVQTVQRCEITPYNISTCNVTGKWTRYDADIELACQSFIDPFNLTYRNYFCYMCNIAELSPPESWWCQDGRDFTLDTNPPFSALLDLNVINDMKKDEELHCDENTQFEDNKLVRYNFPEGTQRCNNVASTSIHRHCTLITLQRCFDVDGVALTLLQCDDVAFTFLQYCIDWSCFYHYHYPKSHKNET